MVFVRIRVPTKGRTTGFAGLLTLPYRRLLSGCIRQSLQQSTCRMTLTNGKFVPALASTTKVPVQDAGYFLPMTSSPDRSSTTSTLSFQASSDSRSWNLVAPLIQPFRKAMHRPSLACSVSSFGMTCKSRTPSTGANQTACAYSQSNSEPCWLATIR